MGTSEGPPKLPAIPIDMLHMCTQCRGLQVSTLDPQGDLNVLDFHHFSRDSIVCSQQPHCHYRSSIRDVVIHSSVSMRLAGVSPRAAARGVSIDHQEVVFELVVLRITLDPIRNFAFFERIASRPVASFLDQREPR